MADTAGQADIRSDFYDSVARNYQNEESIFYGEVEVVSTSAREINYYQRTSGYLTATSPTSIKVAEGASPWVLETSWTKNTAYCAKYMLDSPLITIEDEADSRVKVFADNAEEVTGAIVNDRDGDIFNVATENQSPVNINSVTATAAWDASSGQDPMEDVSEALQKIREQTKRKLKNPTLYVSAKGYKDLQVWLTTQGTKFANVASSLVTDGVLESFGGCKIVVSENVTADYALVAELKKSTTYYEFKAMQTAIINEEMIGRKIRVMTMGIAVLTRPKFNALISNTEE